MALPTEILATAFEQALHANTNAIINDQVIRDRIEQVCRDVRNRACVRFLLACTLAKIHNPVVDIRNPYTEIEAPNTYSGRTYDERFITQFVNEHHLPCNTTTAFLTPAFRNRNVILTPETAMVGRPEALYRAVLQLLTDVQSGLVSAELVLAEAIRWLLLVRDEQQQRLGSLLAGLKTPTDSPLLSADGIVTLIDLHLRSHKASRLPVLIIMAAYQTVEATLNEKARPLLGHNAADKQTGALGDIEIVSTSQELTAVYEMKMRRITIADIDLAVEKLAHASASIDQFLFVTTELIDDDVQTYAAQCYQRIGTEVAILDCLSFLRHFLHLFHRVRGKFLDTYQRLVLAEPDSAVGQALKEAFLTLRQAAETNSDFE